MRRRLEASGGLAILRARFSSARSPEDCDLLEYLVVQACYDARRYSDRPGDDPFEARRKRDKVVIKQARAQLGAIKALKAFLTKYPEYAGAAVRSMHQVKGID